MIIARIADKYDVPFIIKEINDDNVARHVNDDKTFEYFIVDDQIQPQCFIVVEENGEPKGFFYFQNLNSITIDIHTCIRGIKDKIGAGLAAIEFFKSMEIEVIISFIPAYNSAAQKYAGRLGFEVSGRIKKSYLFNGEAIDQIIVSKNIKEGSICQ